MSSEAEDSAYLADGPRRPEAFACEHDVPLVDYCRVCEQVEPADSVVEDPEDD